MKIVKSGATKQDWVGKKVTCAQCGCVFQLEVKDKRKVRFVRGDQRDPGDFWEVRCPECGDKCIINKKR